METKRPINEAEPVVTKKIKRGYIRNLANFTRGTILTFEQVEAALKDKKNTKYSVLYHVIENELLTFPDLMCILKANQDVCFSLSPTLRKAYPTKLDQKKFMERSANAAIPRDLLDFCAQSFFKEDVGDFYSTLRGSANDELSKLTKNGRRYLFFLLEKKGRHLLDGFGDHGMYKPKMEDVAIISKVLEPYYKHDEDSVFAQEAVSLLKQRLLTVMICNLFLFLCYF